MNSEGAAHLIVPSFKLVRTLGMMIDHVAMAKNFSTCLVVCTAVVESIFIEVGIDSTYGMSALNLFWYVCCEFVQDVSFSRCRWRKLSRLKMIDDHEIPFVAMRHCDRSSLFSTDTFVLRVQCIVPPFQLAALVCVDNTSVTGTLCLLVEHQTNPMMLSKLVLQSHQK